ncbi:MAG: acetyltransferase, ribosomal protein N-acetylase [Chthonomonadales bacterium]|nr:acetyltransferase, ribosomal protein N-acetylase [Chthonomonadales bacterium]
MEPHANVNEASSGSPVKVLEIERLLLRRITFEDVDDLTAIFADPETTRFLDGPRTREQMREEIGWYLEAYARSGLHFWAVVHKADNRPGSLLPQRSLPPKTLPPAKKANQLR